MLRVATDEEAVVIVDLFSKWGKTGFGGDCGILFVVDAGNARRRSEVVEAGLSKNVRW